jgi:hypothetical protein
MLSWYAAAVYGAAGGLVVEAVFTWRRLHAWQHARHAAAGTTERPCLSQFIDPAPDLTVALTRAALGAIAGLLLRSEVTGVYAALTVGASAPALLAGLGKATTIAEATSASSDGEPLDGTPRGPALARVPGAHPETAE